MIEKYKVVLVEVASILDDFYYDSVESHVRLDIDVDPIEVTKEELDLLVEYHKKHPSKYAKTAVVVLTDNSTSPSISDTLKEAQQWKKKNEEERLKREQRTKKAAATRKKKELEKKKEQFEKLKKELGK